MSVTILQMEDALNPSTERLKVDRSVEGIVHVLLAKVTLADTNAGHPSRILREQISIFLVQDTVLVSCDFDAELTFAGKMTLA